MSFSELFLRLLYAVRRTARLGGVRKSACHEPQSSRTLHRSTRGCKAIRGIPLDTAVSPPAGLWNRLWICPELVCGLPKLLCVERKVHRDFSPWFDGLREILRPSIALRALSRP